MPRRSILSSSERDSLLALPDSKDELIRHYSSVRLIQNASAAKPALMRV